MSRSPALLLAATAAALALPAAAQSRKLSAPLVPGGDVVQVEASADGRWAVYRSDQEVDGIYELFSVPADGSGAPRKLNGALPLGGAPVPGVRQFLLAPDGRRVVYLADQNVRGVLELFSAPIDGSLPAVRLNHPQVLGVGSPNGSPGVLITPDSSRVVYLADASATHPFGLFSVPIDASSPPVQLVANESVHAWDFVLSADGSRVVYRTFAGKLASVPVDGSQPALSLATGVYAFRVSRFTAHVAFDTPTGPMLYAAPIDGSQPPAPLAGPASSQFIAFLPAASRVVFMADMGPVQDFELYSAPLDGSAPAVKLNPPLVAGGEVLTLKLSADGATAVFLADAVVDERAELFSVPADGSGPALRLNAPLTPGGQVISLLAGARPERILYYADQDVDERLDLFSVPLDGSLAPVRLNGGGPFTDVVLHEASISPDGRAVLYLADEDADEHFELFAAPLDGSHAARKLSGPAPGALVAPFGSRSAGGRAFFLADQDAPGVQELYTSFLERPRAAAAAPTGLVTRRL